MIKATKMMVEIERLERVMGEAEEDHREWEKAWKYESRGEGQHRRIGHSNGEEKSRRRKSREEENWR